MAIKLLVTDKLKIWFDKINDLVTEVNSVKASSIVVDTEDYGLSWKTDGDATNKDSLYKIIDKLIPAPPNAIISNVNIINRYLVRKTGTGLDIYVVNTDTYPNLEIDINNIGYQGQIISANFPLNGVDVQLGDLQLTSGDDTGLLDINGNLKYEVISNPDFYVSNPDKLGVYSVVNTKFTKTDHTNDSIPVGVKNLVITEKIGVAAPYNTLTIPVNVAKQNTTQLSVVNPTVFTTVSTPIKKSGVKTLQPNNIIEINTTISGVVSQGYFNKNHYASVLPNVLPSFNLVHSITPTGDNDNIVVNIPITLPSNISVDIMNIKTTPRTPFNQVGNTSTFDAKTFYDGFPIKPNRPKITSVNDNGTVLTSIVGYSNTSYNENDLMSVGGNFNLMNLSGRFKYPQGIYKYQGDPDINYDSITGRRYEVFTKTSFSGSLFTLTLSNLIGGTGITIPTNYRLYARVDGANPTNGWVSLNKVYQQTSGNTPTNTEDPALVLGTGTNINTKIGTFKVQRTGTLYILLILDDTQKSVSLTNIVIS